MSQLLNKENITISIGEYQKDGQTKQEYRTIGELITMQGDDGSTYQFGRLWGSNGVTKFNVYSREDNNQQSAPTQQSAPQQQNYQQSPAPQQQQQDQQYGNGGYQQR